MRYEVIWQRAAENDLAGIWTAANDREAVTQAAAEIDARLAYEPLRLGESRTSSVHRIVSNPPIVVEFEVIEDDKRVIVQGVFAVS